MEIAGILGQALCRVEFVAGIPLLAEAAAGFSTLYAETHPKVIHHAHELEKAMAELAATHQLARINGLTSRPELNGRSVKVLRFLLDKGRFAVHVETMTSGGEKSGHGMHMNLKPENIKTMSTDASTASAALEPAQIPRDCYAGHNSTEHTKERFNTCVSQPGACAVRA